MAERKRRAPPRQDRVEQMHTEALVNRMGKGNLFQRNNFTDNLNFLLDKSKKKKKNQCGALAICPSVIVQVKKEAEQLHRASRKSGLSGLRAGVQYLKKFLFFNDKTQCIVSSAMKKKRVWEEEEKGRFVMYSP